ncbi:MAG TPA: SBBP repeat-containing protein [Candidatus Marinimicrobia bacterium]|nr:SBBP repeat-containing protein [Candidatus Neomarinimicrobiota bacterium]
MKWISLRNGIFFQKREDYEGQRTGAQKQNSSDDIEPEWVSHYVSGLAPADDVANAIAVDGSGNVYVTGYSEGDNWSIYTTIKYSGETGIVDEIISLPNTVYWEITIRTHSTHLPLFNILCRKGNLYDLRSIIFQVNWLRPSKMG